MTGPPPRAVVEAPAKINLLLRILGPESDGYHSIETLFQALEWGDRVQVTRTRSDELELDVEGPDPAPPGENLALRAAEAFLRATGVPGGARVVLEKKVPAGAGLGGGSSDAAAVLRGLAALTDPPPTADLLIGVGRELGADVPFFLAPSPLCLAWGRGDRLLPLDPLPSVEILLVLPDLHVSTAEAYRALDALDAGGRMTPDRGGPGARGAALLGLPGPEGWEGIARHAENDFERVVFPEHPELEAVRDRLREEGGRPALLTGSGAALFAAFPLGGAGEAAAALTPDLPEGWGTRLTRTRSAPASVVVRSPGPG